MATTRAARGTYNVDLVLDDMNRKGWLAKDLARVTGLSKMTISRFLQRQVQTAPTAKRIAEALEQSIDRYYIPRVAVAS